jgi:integrase/recombinase XerD
MARTRTSPLITRYIKYLAVERGLAANTRQSYLTDLLHLQRWASQERLALRGLTERDIDRYIGSLSRSGLNASSIDRAISAIRGLYQFLHFEREIPTDPTAAVSFLKKTRRLPHVLKVSKVHALINTPDQNTLVGLRDRALLEILFAAGLRLSEAIRLRHQDISLQTRILRCIGKGNKERQIPFSQSAAEALKKYILAQGIRRDSSVFIFLNRGQPLTRQLAWSMIKHYANQAGIGEMTPHTLRHTFATTLLNNGVDTRIVQELMGHASLATTELYLSVSIERIRETYDQCHPRAVWVRT